MNNCIHVCRKYDKFQMNINAKMNALQNAVEKAKKDQSKYDCEYNAALVRLMVPFNYSTQAQEKKRREEQQKLYESELSTREIINHVNGIFLTEQPDVFNIKDGHKYDLES